MKGLIALTMTLLLAASVLTQAQDDEHVTRIDPIPVYRVKVVSRTTKAVNYRHHSGKTELDFRGTNLMPQAEGEADVESRTGRIQIEAKFEHLQKARMLGPEFLTYVLWAITPEGRPVNLGEVIPEDDGDYKLKVSTDLQAFGMIVTAEPYFAVTHPSNTVVLENIVKEKTKGWELPIDARFDLLERGQYVINVPPERLPSFSTAPGTPDDLLEAMNAVAIAKDAGAERYAPDVLRKAEDFLARAQDYYARHESKKAVATVARGAVQSAEDARVLSIQMREKEEQEALRRSSEERAMKAELEAEQAKTEANREARERQEAEEARLQAERERKRAERAAAEAEVAREQAERARATALAEQESAQAQAQQARTAAQQAEQEKEQTRARLLQQLNEVLQTRESARGLIVSMPDVLFDTGKYTLQAGARERLAKVAGILQAYPGLRVEVEGHTDSVGMEDYNRRLSEHRAASVRDFLVSQGVSPSNIGSQGMGESAPVASNETAPGRQLNRRVDLVVSGEAIGQHLGPAGEVPTGSGFQQPSAPRQPSRPLQPMTTPSQPPQEIPH